ncbi:MAG: HdeD family acid-resistance protein [Anaerovoracaceae bacterium]
MRILTMLTGLLFIGAGVFLVANEGVTFLSVAFVAGVMFVIAGIVECLSYSSYRGDNEERSWILNDGTTTFVLGVLILLNKISADAVVPMILGLWVLITGIRNFVHAWEHVEERGNAFYDHLIIGLLNIIFGLYVFFDSEIFNLASVTLIGLCVIVQGINIIHVGATIRTVKPKFIKTKEEMLEEAAAKFEEAHANAKEAIKAAKAAQAELKSVERTPEELLDPTLAPKPGRTEEGTESSDNVQTGSDEEKQDEK